MQLQLAPLNGAGAGGRDEGARPYTAAAAVTVMFSPHREINGTVLDHQLHARAAERSLLVTDGNPIYRGGGDNSNKVQQVTIWGKSLGRMGIGKYQSRSSK